MCMCSMLCIVRIVVDIMLIVNKVVGVIRRKFKRGIFNLYVIIYLYF